MDNNGDEEGEDIDFVPTKEWYKAMMDPLCLLDSDMATAAFEYDTDHVFLNKLLRNALGIKNITIRHVNTEETMAEVGFHGVRLDIYVEGNNGICDVELQNIPEAALNNRAFMYLSNLAKHSLKPGQKYEEMPRLYVLLLMKGKLVQKDDGIINFYEMINKRTGNSLGVNAFIVCFDVTCKADGVLGDIAHDFTEVDPNKMRDPDARKLAKKTKGPWEVGVKMNPKSIESIKRMINSDPKRFGPPLIKLMKKQLVRQGMDKGLKLGKKQGMDAGLKQGRDEEKERMARDMLEDGEDIKKIMKWTRLSQKRIEELRASIDA